VSKTTLDELLLKIVSDAIHSRRRRFFYLNDRHAWLLYAILHKEHIAVTGCQENGEIVQLPGATRDYFVKLGWGDPTGIHNAIHRLEDAGYISIGDFIPDEVERVDRGPRRRSVPQKATAIYEINTKTCITTRHAAVALSTLLAICRKAKETVQQGGTLTGDPVDGEGRVLIHSLIKSAITDQRLGGEANAKEIREILAGEEEGRYLGKIQELVDAGEHLERASHLHVRPRLRLFLEEKYIELVADQPNLEKIREKFMTFQPERGNNTADEQA
jgi:hypothetical protein